MFWILFFIFLMVFAMIGGAINVISDVASGNNNRPYQREDEANHQWILFIALVVILWIIF